MGHPPGHHLQRRRSAEFIVKVISVQSPLRLNFSEKKRICPACIQQPPEALCQDGLYLCCRGRSNGSLVTFPVFGIANGRADFYIPAKKWGMELLRDGNQHEQHSGRLSQRQVSTLTTTSPLTLRQSSFGSPPGMCNFSRSFLPLFIFVFKVFTIWYSVKTIIMSACWTTGCSSFQAENSKHC
jgi:hypothetical protein